MLRHLFMHLFHLSWISVMPSYTAYPNWLLIGYVQNCAARLVTGTRSLEHITPVLRRLHWLPARQRITYKILLLTYKILLLTHKVLNGMASKYIADLLQPYTPTRRLRSSSKDLFVTPKPNLKFYGNRSIQVSAPRLWNSLTDKINPEPWCFLLYIFSLVNLSKSIVSYFLEINFYNCYIYSLIIHFLFLFFRITMIVKRLWVHGKGAL